MPFSISRLRRWFAAAAIFVCLVVAGTYFYARHRVQNALKQVPGKMGIEIQQSAQGFTIAKSEQGRTLFKLQASQAIQFKQGGRAQLHDVTITLYGRDSSRFDQVYGKEFEYDQQSGNVASKGEVAIDLESNPQGILNPDQTTPKELKNPIHLKTTYLVFNVKSGDAWTAAAVEFRVPQASGSAVGARYVAKQSVLTLESQVKIVLNGSIPSTVLAQQAILEKSPRQIVLRYPRAESPDQQAQAEQLTLSLREDNTLDHAVASGHVSMHSTGAQPATASAQKLEVSMKPGTGIQTAVFSGNVQLKSEGPQPAEASAGRAVVSFAGRNTISKIHAEQQVRLLQDAKSRTSGISSPDRREPVPSLSTGSASLHESATQEVEVTAPAMDFLVALGRRLRSAETIGAAQISMLPRNGDPGPQTQITADKFTVKFDSLGRLASVHGEADAKVVSIAPAPNNIGEPDRVSTSDSIDAFFGPGTGIEALVQQGHFTYRAGSQQAFADHARYAPADQILVLNGAPRIVDTGMATSARIIRLNRATGEGFAEGEVKSTYSDMKPQPGGALLASSDPVHVTAQAMTAHNNPAIAVYTGGARLWQNANVIEAPSIQFQKEQRTLIADSKAEQKVSTVLVGTDKRGKTIPVSITARHLSYRDSERKAHFVGGVTVHGSDLTLTSNQMDVFLAASSAATGGGAPLSVLTSPTAAIPLAPQSRTAGPAALQKIIATGSVLMTEPNRHASGEQLVYTAGEDKFVLTGGRPSIFDAERGKITGVSLTLFRRDDRVVVEGDSTSPAITQTRVVR